MIAIAEGQKERPRYPREQALAIAQDLAAYLTPFCERGHLEIVGSLRRGKPDVGDIEILYVPVLVQMPDPGDLFACTIYMDAAARVLKHFIEAGFLAKRPNCEGREAWGPLNKLAIHVESGIPVDFFGTTRENWYNSLVCRTGGALTNKLIASRALERGWTWNVYGSGFTRNTRPGERCDTHRSQSEADVFEFIGLDYLPPEERR